jgi:hypothetical protein
MPKRAREYDRLPPRKLMRVGPRPDYSFALDTLMRFGRLPLEIAQMIMRVAAQPSSILLPIVEYGYTRTETPTDPTRTGFFNSIRMHNLRTGFTTLRKVQWYDRTGMEFGEVGGVWRDYPPAFMRHTF